MIPKINNFYKKNITGKIVCVLSIDTKENTLDYVSIFKENKQVLPLDNKCKPILSFEKESVSFETEVDIYRDIPIDFFEKTYRPANIDLLK